MSRALATGKLWANSLEKELIPPQTGPAGTKPGQEPAAPSLQPLPDLAITMTPRESCSPLMLHLGQAAVPWLLLGIVIAQPLWGFSKVLYGVELTLQLSLLYRHLNTLRDFKAFQGIWYFCASPSSPEERGLQPHGPCGESYGHGQC